MEKYESSTLNLLGKKRECYLDDAHTVAVIIDAKSQIPLEETKELKIIGYYDRYPDSSDWPFYVLVKPEDANFEFSISLIEEGKRLAEKIYSPNLFDAGLSVVKKRIFKEILVLYCTREIDDDGCEEELFNILVAPRIEADSKLS